GLLLHRLLDLGRLNRLLEQQLRSWRELFLLEQLCGVVVQLLLERSGGCCVLIPADGRLSARPATLGPTGKRELRERQGQLPPHSAAVHSAADGAAARGVRA